VSAVAGASRIRLADVLLGTALGVAPSIVLTLYFVDRVRAVTGDPGPVSYSLLAASICLVLATVVFVWRRFGAWDGGSP
jgi:phospholipase D1/2